MWLGRHPTGCTGHDRAQLKMVASFTAAAMCASATSYTLCRGRLRRDLCDFAGAEADFRAVLDAKPSHSKAEQELDRASRGLQALEAARIARYNMFKMVMRHLAWVNAQLPDAASVRPQQSAVVRDTHCDKPC